MTPPLQSTHRLPRVTGLRWEHPGTAGCALYHCVVTPSLYDPDVSFETSTGLVELRDSVVNIHHAATENPWATPVAHVVGHVLRRRRVFHGSLTFLTRHGPPPPRSVRGAFGHRQTLMVNRWEWERIQPLLHALANHQHDHSAPPPVLGHPPHPLAKVHSVVPEHQRRTARLESALRSEEFVDGCASGVLVGRLDGREIADGGELAVTSHRLLWLPDGAASSPRTIEFADLSGVAHVSGLFSAHLDLCVRDQRLRFHGMIDPLGEDLAVAARVRAGTY